MQDRPIARGLRLADLPSIHGRLRLHLRTAGHHLHRQRTGPPRVMRHRVVHRVEEEIMLRQLLPYDRRVTKANPQVRTGETMIGVMEDQKMA